MGNEPAERALRSRVYSALYNYAGRAFADKRTEEVLGLIEKVVAEDLDLAWLTTEDDNG